MNGDTTQRFASLEGNNAEKCIDVVGAGTIGSYTVLVLAKSGFGVRVWDPQEVEPPNVGVQLYGRGDVKKSKVDALYPHMLSGAPDEQLLLDVRTQRYTVSPNNLAGINAIVLAVDSIESRRDIVQGIRIFRSRLPNDFLFIDARMSFDSVEFHTYRPQVLADRYRWGRYRDCLMDTEQQYVEDPCGSHAHPGAGMFCASVISSLLLSGCNGKPVPHSIFGSLSTFESIAYWRAEDKVGESKGGK